MGNVSSQIETTLTTVALYPCTLVKPFPVACCNETVASLQPNHICRHNHILSLSLIPFSSACRLENEVVARWVVFVLMR